MAVLLKAILLAAIILVIASPSTARPKFIECADSDECSVGYCCMLGQGRFSIPRCEPLRMLGQQCSPSNEVPRNASISYPNFEQIVRLTNVYFNVCSCDDGLTCSAKSGTCEEHVFADNNLW